MKKSPFSPLVSEVYWYRPTFIKYATLLIFILGTIEGIISWSVGAAYTNFSFSLGIWGIICYFILIFSKKHELTTGFLFMGLSFIIAFRSYEVHSAMNALYLTLILIAAGILLSLNYVIFLFILDLIFVIIAVHNKVFTWEQPVDPINGLFYANNVGVLFPSLILSFLIAIIITRVLLQAIQNQINHQRLIQETQDYLVQKEKISSIQVLAGGIAHDFNNLLTAIIGNLNLLNLKQNPIVENEEYIKEIENASEKARYLANQLLSFSKPTKPNKSSFDLQQFLNEFVEFTLRGRKTKAEYEISSMKNQIFADKDQLSLVIQNLVLNADQAMPNGGIIQVLAKEITLTEIHRKSIIPGKYFQISINDHGIGMSSEQMKHLFEPFYTTKPEGTGLGLAISYSIVTNHGGYILVDSILGKGTKFDIFIPIIDIPLLFSSTEEFQIKKFSGSVLIVDDNHDVQNVLSKMLEKLGFSVKIAFNGNEALRIFEEMQQNSDKFMFLIIDLILPGEIGGQEIIKKIHEKIPKVKAIVSSGYSKDNVIDNYEDYGFSAVLNKPYTINQLIEVIKKIL